MHSEFSIAYVLLILFFIHFFLENNLSSHAFEERVLPIAVIMAPTRELAIQIFNEARKFSSGSALKICIAYGGTAVVHQRKVLQVCFLKELG